MYICHACGYDFREAARSEAFFADEVIQQSFDDALTLLARPPAEVGRFDLRFYAVAHQLCRVMGSRQNHGRLQAFVADWLRLLPMLPPSRRICFEQLRRDERHQFLLCALWLMADIQSRLEAAWVAKAVRYNLMLKDFDEPPRWYCVVVRRFSDWRSETARSPT